MLTAGRAGSSVFHVLLLQSESTFGAEAWFLPSQRNLVKLHQLTNLSICQSLCKQFAPETLWKVSFEQTSKPDGHDYCNCKVEAGIEVIHYHNLLYGDSFKYELKILQLMHRKDSIILIAERDWVSNLVSRKNTYSKEYPFNFDFIKIVLLDSKAKTRGNKLKKIFPNTKTLSHSSLVDGSYHKILGELLGTEFPSLDKLKLQDEIWKTNLASAKKKIAFSRLEKFLIDLYCPYNKSKIIKLLSKIITILSIFFITSIDLFKQRRTKHRELSRYYLIPNSIFHLTYFLRRFCHNCRLLW